MSLAHAHTPRNDAGEMPRAPQPLTSTRLPLKSTLHRPIAVCPSSKMLTRSDILRILRDHYPELACQYGIKRIALFGSYARDAATPTSDVDLLVEFERPIGLRIVELAEHLERLLDRPVDILTPAGVQSIRIPRVAQSIQESLVYV